MRSIARKVEEELNGRAKEEGRGALQKRHLRRDTTIRNRVDNQRDSATNFIRSYLHQFFDDSHGLKASLKPLRRPFDRCQSRLEAINIG